MNSPGTPTARPEPFDAWAFAVLRAGRPLNGEVERVGDALRPFARRMAGAAAVDRGRIWDALLALLPENEADALVEGVAAADPDALPPEGEPWEALRLGELPPVEPFPDYVLPDRVADSLGCPRDFVGLAVLVVAGAAIGRSVSLQLKPGYFAGASLYGMNIGGPSSGKSPAQEAAVAPMWRIDERLHETYLALKESYDAATAAMAAVPKGQAKPPLPVKPALESAVLDDCTVEAIAPHLAASERGILVSRDEGSAWVASLGQYKSGRGSDRQFWLSALFNKSVRVDRKGNPDMVPIRVPHPFLSFIGGMPPDMLAGLREPGGRSDGFVERILFTFPNPFPTPHWSDHGIPEDVRENWAEIIGRLRDRPMAAADGKRHPQVLRLSPEAKAAWVAAYDAHADAVNDPGFDPGELAMEGKLSEFAARLALILHMLHLACDPIAERPDPPPPVSRWAVAGAIKLWFYFRSQHRRVRAYLGGKGLAGAPEGARLVLRWLRNHPDVDVFPESELTRDVPHFRKDRAAMEDGLLWLSQRRTLRRVPVPERPKGTRGRKATPAWEVHPYFRHSENSENSEFSENGPAGDASEPNSPESPNSPNSPNPVRTESQEGGGDDRPPF
jgi:hypothetical protein